MLRPSASDPVLIKPSRLDFIRDWNEEKVADYYSYLHPPGVDQLYGILLLLADQDADAKMAKSDRERRQKKLKYKLRRRNSVLMANFKEEYPFPEGKMKRSWSCTELGKTECRETTSTKRVSFSINIPLGTQCTSTEIRKCSYNLGPAKVQSRPILVRRATTFSGRDNLTHMDFDSFTAWRRGSRMSDDVVKNRPTSSKKKIKKEKEAIQKDDNDSEKKDDWWIVKMFRLAFDNCCHRQRITPSPPPTSAEGIVISIMENYEK